MSGLYNADFALSVQKDTLPPDVSGSRPELFAARHTTIAKYRIGVEHFAVCTCGHVEEIFTDTWPRRCGLEMVVESYSFVTESQFTRDLKRTVDAGARDGDRLNRLLHVGE